jgi:hypothetical protein
MSIPTHSSDCVTKIFKTNCPDCNSKVFFFSCNCGSKVYFESIGDPWPQHFCRNHEIKFAIDLVRNSDRMKDSEIIKLIEDHSKKIGRQLSEELWDIIENELGKRKKPFNFTEISCDIDIVGFSGRIIEINKSINFYKRLGLDKTAPFSFDFLGEFRNGNYYEIKLRDNPDKNNHSRQITFYADVKILNNISLKIGDVITVKLRKSNSISPLWVISFIQKL